MRTRIAVLAFLCITVALVAQDQPQTDQFKRVEVMVPMRDGAHLQTVYFVPLNQKEPLPILMVRTPYGVPETEQGLHSPSMKELVDDGYVFVYQNLRGRFKSEGIFNMSMAYDPKSANESTDAYDTVDWLVKNISNNNGKVGIFGVSYPGLTAILSTLEPHPALKAVSEQASPADQWMNDDFHRFGALRLSYAFEYSVMEEADKNANTHFDFDKFDTFQWYLDLGSLSNINGKYLHGKLPAWNNMAEHPNYDSFWQKESFTNQIHGATVPNLNVAGFWDQEDPWGPWKIYYSAEKNDPKHYNFMVAGPWNHGGWRGKDGSHLGQIPFGGHNTSLEFRENIEAPWFRYWLHGEGQPFKWEAQTFQTGSNTWHKYSAWPPKEAQSTNLYLLANGELSFDAPKSTTGFAEYVSDPANPVPYRHRPISPTYPGGDWTTWEVQDQRFVEGRPDVLTFESKPLDHDITVTGELAADLFASTTGTDSDWIVKLIDVYPEDTQPRNIDAAPYKPGEYAQSLNGYELIIAAEVARARFRKSFENPVAVVPNEVTEYKIPLRSHDHVFLKGHRIMVQVQSTWFPIIDRNPQKFVPNIFQAKETDFTKATQRVYGTAQAPSHIVLPVMPTSSVEPGSR
jgi:putative CocE/NonD family hydrolase